MNLTKAENEVYELLLSGLSNSEIAAKRSVSEKTIKWQLTSIYKKMGVSGDRQLIATELTATRSRLHASVADIFQGRVA
jgi:DNA-binding CsgD family transcriptional regulator